MKKYFTIILAAIMILSLVACAPQGDTNATTDPVVKNPVHCICGANEGEDHIGGCTGEKVEWTAWTGDTFPLESGYYYAAHETNEVTLARTNYAKNVAADGKARNIVIDLNGKTFFGPGDILVKMDAVMTFTITDSSAGHTASITATEELTTSTIHSLLYLDDTNEEDTATLNIYRVMLDASATKGGTIGGSVIFITETNVLNMYNATVKGGSVVDCGGAIKNSGTAYLRDCVVYGSEVTNREEDTNYGRSALGGAIHTDGDLQLIDCTIYGAAAGRGGALNIEGGNIVMEGGIIYAGDVLKSGGAINMKAALENGATFTMKSSDKGDPVIDASKNTAGGFGGAINIDGYVALTKFVMESGEIRGGTASGAGGGAILIQDTENGGTDLKGILEINGGTISGGIGTGGCIYIANGGVLQMNGGTITKGVDASDAAAGGVYIADTVCKMVVSGDAQITGNEGCDVYIAGVTPITIAEDWTGNGDTPMAVGMKEGVTVFAIADDGVSLTDDYAAFFSVATGTVELADNTLTVK